MTIAIEEVKNSCPEGCLNQLERLERANIFRAHMDIHNFYVLYDKDWPQKLELWQIRLIQMRRCFVVSQPANVVSFRCDIMLLFYIIIFICTVREVCCLKRVQFENSHSIRLSFFLKAIADEFYKIEYKFLEAWFILPLESFSSKKSLSTSQSILSTSPVINIDISEYRWTAVLTFSEELLMCFKWYANFVITLLPFFSVLLGFLLSYVGITWVNATWIHMLIWIRTANININGSSQICIWRWIHFEESRNQ